MVPNRPFRPTPVSARDRLLEAGVRLVREGRQDLVTDGHERAKDGGADEVNAGRVPGAATYDPQSRAVSVTK